MPAPQTTAGDAPLDPAPASKVTLLIHTRDRPDFLLRLLDYLEGGASKQGLSVIVLDASAPDTQADLGRLITSRGYAMSLEAYYHPTRMGLLERISIGVKAAKTPYVMLAADDDFYFFEWLDVAIPFLDEHADYGVLYGQWFIFELDSYAPYGRTVAFPFVARPNPPTRWLEGDTALERLAELSAVPSGLATTGWYALQRRSLLDAIVTAAMKHELSNSMFEKLLTFAQAALSKTRMVDRVFIARQVAPSEMRRPPLSFAQHKTGVERLKAASMDILAMSDAPESAWPDIVDNFYRYEIELMQAADRKRHLRMIADNVPFARNLWRLLRSGKPGTSQAAHDSRLPVVQTIEECGEYPAQVKSIVLKETSGVTSRS